MRLKQVNPHKQPVGRGSSREVGTQLVGTIVRGRELLLLVLEPETALVEGGEALVVDEKNRGRVECSGANVVAAEGAGKRLRIRAEALQKQRTHVLPRHQRRYRVRGVRRGGVRRIEHRALARQGVEPRGGVACIAVSTDVIGSKGVDRHEEDVTASEVERAFTRSWLWRRELIVERRWRLDEGGEPNRVREHGPMLEVDPPQVVLEPQALGRGDRCDEGKGEECARQQREQAPDTRRAWAWSRRSSGMPRGRDRLAN